MSTPATRTSRPRAARRAAAVVAGCLGAALALTGCTPPAPEADADVDYELTAQTDAPSGDIDSFSWVSYAEPYSLDYAYAFDYSDNQVLANVCESLLRLNPDYTLTPGARGVLRAPDADDVGVHDPRRRDLPRRHPAHGRRRRRVDEPTPRSRGRLVVVLGVPERHLDRADRRPRGHRDRGIRRLAVQPRHGRLGRRDRIGRHARRGGRRLRQLDRRRELHRAVQPDRVEVGGAHHAHPLRRLLGRVAAGASRARSSSSS